MRIAALCLDTHIDADCTAVIKAALTNSDQSVQRAGVQAVTQCATALARGAMHGEVGELARMLTTMAEKAATYWLVKVSIPRLFYAACLQTSLCECLPLLIRQSCLTQSVRDQCLNVFITRLLCDSDSRVRSTACEQLKLYALLDV